MGRRRRKNQPPSDPREAVDVILADAGIHWFGIRHYSPACGVQVRRLIEQVQPVAVLVEGPDDATELIEWIVHPDTTPPLTVLSTWVDKKNALGRNGELSPSADVPARYRGWWPVVAYGPEYAALSAGSAVGADLRFIDAPLKATLPYARASQQVVNDRHLAESSYFDALRLRRHLRSFDEFWQSTFEVPGVDADPVDFQRAVLTFAWCSRHVHDDDDASLDADGTLLRERHMRWHVDRVRKEHPGGEIVVVTGAFHAVALPFTKGKRAKGRADRYTRTLVCQHSHRALSRLYGMNRLPEWGQRVHERVAAGSATPFEEAATDLLLDVQRLARSRGAPVSTADSVGAVVVARNLAALRGHPEPTLLDVLDAVQMAYIKGDRARAGGSVQQAAREVLIGRRIGEVTPEAGQAPIIADFYAAAKSHRVDVSGDHKTVRCDVHKQPKHRLKSAFLHRCAFLDVPLFEAIDDRSWRTSDAYYRGPDLVTGEGMHLITETWGIRWREDVDDRLLELSDRGTTVEQVAQTTLLEQLEGAEGDAAAVTRLLLRSTQMRLTPLFDQLLAAVDRAVGSDGSFAHLVDALADFVVLYGYRTQLATAGHDRVARTILGVFQQACLRLPSLRAVSDEDVAEATDRLQTLVRTALTLELPTAETILAPDRELLVEQVRRLVSDHDVPPAIRGAGFGVLYALGGTREAVVARELDGYLLGPVDRVADGGAFLEGLFGTARNVFLSSPRLLRTVTRAITRLDAETFRRLLPDLRRAFTSFIPTELDAIGERVAAELGLREVPDLDAPVPDEVRAAVTALDSRVAEVLAGRGL